MYDGLGFASQCLTVPCLHIPNEDLHDRVRAYDLQAESRLRTQRTIFAQCPSNDRLARGKLCVRTRSEATLSEGLVTDAVELQGEIGS